jgi:hypothetical protein
MTPVSMACHDTGINGKGRSPRDHGLGLVTPEKSEYLENHNEDYEGEEKWKNYR